MTERQGKKALVLGAARQGLSAARFLARQGANVLLNDLRPESQFSTILAELHRAGIQTRFGGHPLDLLDGVDLVCISGGVPLENPLVIKARNSGIPLTNDSQLFMESVNARVVGITGSAGKTTTTTLLGEIAQQAAGVRRKAWVGGNIGYPMLDHVDEIGPEDWVVLEFSSFQLELMTISPHIAVVLNISPNHLDRHKSMQNYVAAKSHILQFQNDTDIAILNHEDRNFSDLKQKVKGRLITFGSHPATDNDKVLYLDKNMVVLRENDDETPLIETNCLQLPGRHNQLNLLAACAASIAAGFPIHSIAAGVERVKSIPHRLETVREHRGVRWVNDSIATAPERVMAALHAVPPPLILLLGGRDKDLPWEELAACLHELRPRIILFGEAANLIFSAIEKYERGDIPYGIYTVEDLEQAVQQAAAISRPGDIVLLSPGGTSYDAYYDFEERGSHFRQLVEAIP